MERQTPCGVPLPFPPGSRVHIPGPHPCGPGRRRVAAPQPPPDTGASSGAAPRRGGREEAPSGSAPGGSAKETLHPPCCRVAPRAFAPLPSAFYGKRNRRPPWVPRCRDAATTCGGGRCTGIGKPRWGCLKNPAGVFYGTPMGLRYRSRFPENRYPTARERAAKIPAGFLGSLPFRRISVPISAAPRRR